MKNRIIASLVGGIIIFIWQFLSWTISGIHDGAAKYHPQQNEIMNALSTHFTETGMYMLPTTSPDASREDQEKMMKDMEGKPYASVLYVKTYESNMARQMIRGFLIDVFLVFLLIYMLTRAGVPTLVRWIAGSVAAGLFTWLWGPYTAHNWFLMPWDAISGHLVDAIVAWGLCGIWLGWYFNRRTVVK